MDIFLCSCILQSKHGQLGKANIRDGLGQVPDTFEEAAGQARDRRCDVREAELWVPTCITCTKTSQVYATLRYGRALGIFAGRRQ